MMATTLPRIPALLAAILFLFAASGCQTDWPVPDYASAEAVEEAIMGASYVGTLPDGSSVCIYHAPEGHFLGRANGLISGQWSVGEDGLCYLYLQGPGTSDCRRLAISGTRANLYYADVVIGEGRLSQGNVCA